MPPVAYQAAFLNGIAWNVLNMSIAFWLLLGRIRPHPGGRVISGEPARPVSQLGHPLIVVAPWVTW